MYIGYIYSFYTMHTECCIEHFRILCINSECAENIINIPNELKAYMSVI